MLSHCLKHRKSSINYALIIFIYTFNTRITCATIHIRLAASISVLFSPTRKLRCCGAQLLRKFLPWSTTFAQLWQISGCFALKIFHFGDIWGQIGPLSTRNLSFSKFVAVCPKLATSCFHTSFHSRWHWARVARLMTLQRSLQYSLRLSWTKTFFQRYLTFALH